MRAPARSCDESIWDYDFRTFEGSCGRLAAATGEYDSADIVRSAAGNFTG